MALFFICFTFISAIPVSMTGLTFTNRKNTSRLGEQRNNIATEPVWYRPVYLFYFDLLRDFQSFTDNKSQNYWVVQFTFETEKYV